MNWVVYFCGSGLAFFVGVGCLLAALAGASLPWKSTSRIASLVAILGVILAGLSGTPLPVWFYTLAGLLTITWLSALHFSQRISWPTKIGSSTSVAVVWLGGAIVELPYQMPPTLSPASSPQVYLFGDSVSAGINENDPHIWPRLLARAHEVDVSDYSRAGATVAVARKRAKEAALGDGIVLLEIGGNDLLGTTSAADFNQNLESLLEEVCQPGRQVLMFELPLPPLRNEFGRIQRRLAARYQVLLIPKRVLIGVLTADDTTLDSIHLSASGHQRMAEAVWQIIRPAYARR